MHAEFDTACASRGPEETRPSPQALSASAELFPPTRGKLVVVIDDERAVRELIAGVLVPLEVEVLGAADGAQGLMLCRARPPDLVLVDIGLPAGNGLEICRALKGNPTLRLVPVMVITGAGGEESLAAAFAAGAEDFLPKPFANVELVARVKAHLRTKALADSLLVHIADGERREAAQDRLLQLIVHDMKSPITGMVGFMQLLMEGQELAPERRERIMNGMFSSCQELMHLVRNILDLGVARAGRLMLNPVSFRVAEELERVCHEMEGVAEARGVAIRLRPGAGDFPLLADRGVVRRVLANFLSNALEHSQRGSEVEVFAETCRWPRGIGIGVRDAGCGVAPEDLPRLFDAYTRLAGPRPGRPASTGLGLSFCKLAVEAHGGSIQVESEPGKGSCFTAWFPVSTGASP